MCTATLNEEEAFAQLSWLAGGDFCGGGGVPAQLLQKNLQSIEEHGPSAAFSALPEDEQTIYKAEALVSLGACCTWMAANRIFSQSAHAAAMFVKRSCGGVDMFAVCRAH